MADLCDGAFDDTKEIKLKRKKTVNTALNLEDCDYEKQDDIEDATSLIMDTYDGRQRSLR
jgi:hypothetical protein